MNYYMLLLRQESIDFGSYGSEDFQKIVADFDRWNAAMIAESQLILSANLKDGEGRTVQSDAVVKDGPYTETREAVTGIFIIRANDYDEALELARGCPFVVRGGSVEVRQIPQLEFEDAAVPLATEQRDARAAGQTGDN